MGYEIKGKLLGARNFDFKDLMIVFLSARPWKSFRLYSRGTYYVIAKQLTRTRCRNLFAIVPTKVKKEKRTLSSTTFYNVTNLDTVDRPSLLKKRSQRTPYR